MQVGENASRNVAVEDGNHSLGPGGRAVWILRKSRGQREPGELILEDQHAAGKGDGDQVHRQEDARPEVKLEERPPQPKPAWMVDKIAEEPHGLPGPAR